MIVFLAFLAASIFYGAFYAVKCFQNGRAGQAVAVLSVLLLPAACAYALILYLAL